MAKDVDAARWTPESRFGRAFRIDAQAAYELFLTMPTTELQRLRTAHEADLLNARRPESIAFGGGRLALIRYVLYSRATGDPRRKGTSGSGSETSGDVQ